MSAPGYIQRDVDVSTGSDQILQVRTPLTMSVRGDNSGTEDQIANGAFETSVLDVHANVNRC